MEDFRSINEKFQRAGAAAVGERVKVEKSAGMAMDALHSVMGQRGYIHIDGADGQGKRVMHYGKVVGTKIFHHVAITHHVAANRISWSHSKNDETPTTGNGPGDLITHLHKLAL